VRTGRSGKKGILERLRDGVVLGDGGYILELERRGYVQAGPYTPEVAIEHPGALRELHREFLRAGADVLHIGSCCGSVAHHVRAMAEALGRRPPASAKSADLGRHPGIQKSRTLEEMAGMKPKSADAPRFATGHRHW